ncbi:MAG: hypothetical protein QM714_07650 [Nocardioides sp.]|uniref:hypothetical protein n=1 Tax=Nocardioides sp. TaxID=35761 RepID=UPI0039E562AB
MTLVVRLLGAVAAAALLVGVGWVAMAVPPTGPGPDTPGTSGSVSPRSLRAGQTLSFRISGFPGGEIVYIKIDDGKVCSQSGVHGACVVAQQRIPSSGAVSGSLVLPGDLKPGAHWLRFLASKKVYDANGDYQGVKGYTLRGNSDFTVLSGSTNPGSSTQSPGSSTAPSQSASAADQGDAGIPEAGATLSVSPAAETSSGPTAGDPAGERPAESDPATEQVTAAADETTAASFPVVGVVGLAVLVGLALLVLVTGRRARE